MPGTERPAEPRPSSDPELLVLAALERAVCHRPDGAPVRLAAVIEHLALGPRGAEATAAARRLRTLGERGLAARSRRHGTAVWSPSATGRALLGRERGAGRPAALPESPQHRAWREARASATLELERLRTELGAELGSVVRLLAGTRPPRSDAWFELSARLGRAAWRVGAASHCLHEWPEPGEDRPDVDERTGSGDAGLSQATLERRRALRSGRRNAGLWRARPPSA